MTYDQLSDMEVFSRADYYSALQSRVGDKSDHALSYALRKDIEEGKVVHIGRNQYSFPKEKRVYIHHYSDEAQKAAEEIKSEYPEVNFQIFELTQLNAFVNHQIAHNTIFISVENEVMDYVFDSLRWSYPGRIMLKPSVDDYFKYLVDDQLVVIRLTSESPKTVSDEWKSRLEKILVDITVDKLLSHIVPSEEYEAIFKESFERYLLDMNTMFRYANRRGASSKFKARLNEYIQIAPEEKA